MKSRLIALFDNPSFGVGTIKKDAGLMMNQYGEIINHLTLFYPDFVEVFLCLEGEPGREDVLVKGIGETLKAARQEAIKKFNAEAYGKALH